MTQKVRGGREGGKAGWERRAEEWREGGRERSECANPQGGDRRHHMRASLSAADKERRAGVYIEVAEGGETLRVYK